MSMGSEAESQFGTLLEYLALELDVPEDVRREAVARYDDLGKWVKNDCQDRFRTDSEVYPQGSIRLGTMVQPVKDEDDYDVDLVYRRELTRPGVTQQGLKDQIGQQLKSYLRHLLNIGEEVPTLEEGRRCWTLRYRHRFHMDVLPAIPDDESSQNNVRDVDDGILITDKELRLWQPSNPRGYANWFDEQQTVRLLEGQRAMAKAANVDIEEIPLNVVKTPLRQAIQLLKRHRDVRYQGNPDDKPISVIITTLAARAYGQETTPYEALTGIATRMGRFVVRRDVTYWVPNPVNPNENFADKWQADPARAVRFFDWLGQVQNDLANAGKQKGLDKVVESLSSAFGEGLTKRAASRYGDALSEQRESGGLRMARVTGMLGAAGAIAVKRHTFFGGCEQDQAS